MTGNELASLTSLTGVLTSPCIYDSFTLVRPSPHKYGSLQRAPYLFPRGFVIAACFVVLFFKLRSLTCLLVRSLVLSGLVLCCASLCCVVRYCAALSCAMLHCTVLCCTVLYCIVLYCIVLCRIELHCTVQQ